MPDEIVLLGPGETVPDNLPIGTRVFVSFDAGALPLGSVFDGGGIVAPPLSDGCLGHHWPESSTCAQHEEV